ncbi:ASCH domain-containing protein [Pandoraea bronchicola]|uniref:ASCH domain-containing protein n=1 Tax=Pandoraea bronchicola TaxID=2508287 RepID=A0A5E5BZ50_9BURK|nr:ASCH domain-containing protein [Pandoraea bronchicola]VVE90768.1 hypothetical protein PBR20603_04756 [Pandoraea bronchicola]
MKALSVRQPWAWLIVNGFKDIENRTWRTGFRGRVLVHASKGMTRAEYEDVEDFLRYAVAGPRITLPVFDELDRGGIVGAATIIDCIPPERASSAWHMEDQFGFEISDARTIPFVPCKGALGFFDVPPDVAAQLREIAASQAAEERKS